MAKPVKARTRTRPNPYGELLHLLNQRYHREWVRAEALESELVGIKNSPFGPLIAGLRKLKRWFRGSSARKEPALTATSLPYLAPETEPAGSAKVSIVIPFRDRIELLRNCLRSLKASSYRNFQVILVDHGSRQKRTVRFLARLEQRRNLRIIAAPGSFNFSRLCNTGAQHADGDYLLFLNNDVEIVTTDWLEQLLRIGGDPRVGIVGATLLYPDRTIQHAGLFPRTDGLWVHPYQGCPERHRGDAGELDHTRIVPGVTAACLLIRRSLFREMAGFDERFPVAYNDVDLCERVKNRGLCVVITPHARLIHYEGLSRGYTVDKPERIIADPGSD